MALTNDEKMYLRSKVKQYIRNGTSKAEAIHDLMREGFNVSTIKKYWFIFENALKRNPKESE